MRAILPRELVKPFQFQFEGRLYKEEPELERDESWKRDESRDGIAYDEELYLLSPNVLDALLQGEQGGLPLHLSEEQIAVLNVPGPVLLSGEAGSGKTSVITQWLVINHLRHNEVGPKPVEPLRQLFVTFSERLRDHADYDFQAMLPKSARNHRTTFKKYRDVLNDILDVAGERHSYLSENEMTFERFLREYASDLHQSSIDPVLLWDEIRSVIKGGATEKSDVLLDFARYNQLSEERGQCKTPSNLREPYYEAAQAYQNHLFRNALWDAIDLARACIRSSGLAEKYDKLACDEIQDLAPVEIVLLLGLLKSGDVSDVFCTGDVAQVINPSGFRWARLKAEMYRRSHTRPTPDVHYLKRNYRSCFEIVDLVNRVISVRRDLLDDEVSRVEQVPLLPANVRPMVLRKNPIESLRSLPSNPKRRLILTKTPGDKNTIEGVLGQARDGVSILTIEEAKGLEYDGVLLWNFFRPRNDAITKNDWERVFTPGRRQRLKEDLSRGEGNLYGLTYEFNLLHVGLTRARTLLFVYDEDPQMRIANLGGEVPQALTSADTDAFDLHWKTESPTPKELHELGISLIGHDNAQARRMFLLAAAAAEKLGLLRDAAESYKAGGDHKSSASCYKAVGDEPNELWERAQYHQSNSEWLEAGRLLEQRGKILVDKGNRRDASDGFESARLTYVSGSDFKSASRCALLAAESLPLDMNKERAVKFEEAADAFEKAKGPSEVILVLERAIQEAQSTKQAGKSILSGEPNEDWIALQYKRIATGADKLNRHADAALAAHKAAGLWMGLAGDEKFGAQYQARYEARCCEALSISTESYIKAGETTQAASVQDQLLRRFKGGVEEAKSTWNRFGTLYVGRGELDQFAETFLQLAGYLGSRKEYREALEQLDFAVKQCEDRGASRLIIKLLQRRLDIATKAADPHGTGESFEKLAMAYESTGDRTKAFENMRNSGAEYWRDKDEDRAGQIFEKAYDLALTIMTPVEIGWYCYNDVTSGAYSTRGMFKESFFWINRACIHFTQDTAGATKRLMTRYEEQSNEVKRLTEQLASADSGARKQELERNQREELKALGLIQATLSRVYGSASRTSQDKKTIQQAQDWEKAARESFKSSRDPDAIQELDRRQLSST
jgi:hypothetical protein